MTRDTKARLLTAFDALNVIAAGGPVEPRQVGKGRCGVCGGPAWREEHDHACSVGRAIAAIRGHIPSYLERERWLADSSTS